MRRAVAEAVDKPTLLLLADTRDWAFDHYCRQLAAYLDDEFNVEIEYVREAPKLRAERYVAVLVCFWGETYLQQFGFDPARVIKLINSHRWQDDPRYGPCTPAELVARHLWDARTVMCSSRRLYDLVQPVFSRTFHARTGSEPTLFFRKTERRGPLVVGWAGNAKDPLKGYHDIIVPACAGRFDLRTADGGLSHEEMNDFYNEVDVLLVTSRHEGEPTPLIESLAAGCFPVCTDVGIVPEVIEHEVNGLILRERSVDALREALAWCETNLSRVRRMGLQNAVDARKLRPWAACADDMRRVFHDTIRQASAPRFRNDDVSWDTPLEHLERFCATFRKHGLRQVHGITLNGSTSVRFKHGDTAAEYDGYDNSSRLDNDTIRRLAAGQPFEAREDLISFLRSTGDEIALHGLYHTDYSKMSATEQRHDLEAGLALLHRLFPGQPIHTFIPPFNRFNADTVAACAQLGLRISAAEGVHLEAELGRLELSCDTLYRYHHHRFYPETKFDYYQLSIERLEAALEAAVLRRAHRTPNTTLARRVATLASPAIELGRRVRDRFTRGTVEIDLPRDAVVAAVARHGAEPWFVHAFDARQERWDIRVPARFIADGWPRDAKVFEVGCGCALNLIWLGQQGFRNLQGSDLLERHVDAGRDLVAQARLSIELWQDDALRPVRLPEQCDVIVALIWTHLVVGFDLGTFLATYLSALAPGGCIIVDVIDRAYDRVPGNQYHSADGNKPESQRRPSEYVARFSPEQVAAAAAEQGLTVLHRFSREQAIPKQIYVLMRSRG